MATPMTTAMAVRLARSLRPSRPLSATRVISVAPWSLEGAHHLEHLLGAGLAQLTGDAPVGQEQDVIGDRRRAGLVRDHHDRLVIGLGRLAQQLENLAAGP